MRTTVKQNTKKMDRRLTLTVETSARAPVHETSTFQHIHARAHPIGHTCNRGHTETDGCTELCTENDGMIRNTSGLHKSVMTVWHPELSPDSFLVESSEVKLRERALYPEIRVVYFANIYVCKNDPLSLVLLQLTALKATRLLEMSTIDIVVCGPPEMELKSRVSIASLLIPRVNLIYSNENAHEYPGLLRFWEIAQEVHGDENTVLLYYHSKGITRYRGDGIRDGTERWAFNVVIEPWERVRSLFAVLPTITKIGITHNESGWMWHNVFWARASYVSRVERPKRDSDRYYYERWIAYYIPSGETHHVFHPEQCFNLLVAPDVCHIGTSVCCLKLLDGSVDWRQTFSKK